MISGKSRKYQILFRMMSIFFVISIGMNLIGGAYVVRRNDMETTSEEQQEIGDLVFTEESLNQYVERYYKNQLTKLLTPEELNYIAQRQWEYVLSANGKEFTSNIMYLDGVENLRIMLAEVVKEVKLLPEEMLRQGSVWQSDEEIELTDYIKIYAPIPYEIGKEELNGNVKYYYDFKGIKPGTIITFQMGEILREKLRYSDNIKGNRVEVIIR